MRLRTAFLHHGYHVTVFSEVASNYLRGWLIPDALSAVPIDLIAAAATRATEPDWNTAVYLLRLLRVLRIGRLLRKMAQLSVTASNRLLSAACASRLGESIACQHS